MVEVAKETLLQIEDIIRQGMSCSLFEDSIKFNMDNLLQKINERKTVSNSSVKFFNLLLNSILLIRNKDNFKIENFVDTVSRLSYNRYHIKKHIEEEQRILAKKIKNAIEYFEMAENKIESIS